MRYFAIVLAGSTLASASAQQSHPATGPYTNGVVAADHPKASEAGLEMLKAGGNCVDAAVATSFALSVVRPASCGIGGGGFMVIWNADKQEATALDYRERAPMAASADMYDAAEPGTEIGSVRGPKAAGVPGTVAGLCYAAKHYGSLPLSKLLEPAIRLAEEGYGLDATDVRNQKSTLAKLDRYDGYRTKYSGLLNGYLGGGTAFKVGQRFKSPQLPALKLIAKHGRDGFYTGPVAEAILAATKSAGVMTAEDLRRMQPVVRKPLMTTFDGKQILTMPPPSSGGAAIIEMLNTLKAWERQNPSQSLDELGHNTEKYAQLLAEAMKHAFADRAEFLGDTDFADVPLDRLTDQAYANEIAKRISLDATKKPADYGRFFAANDSGTSHLSVIDKHGNAVACTETINLTYGSFVVVPEFGFILNDEMDDFAARPGEPNAFGLIQSAANAVAPRKKPLSSMTPTIVIEDGKAIGAMGASGGPRIITATFQVLLNQIRFGLKPQAAVNQPRLHHQWAPNRLSLEAKLFDKLKASLQTRGHEVLSSSGLGVSQSVGRIDNKLFGGSDPRKLGRPAGY